MIFLQIFFQLFSARYWLMNQFLFKKKQQILAAK